MYWYGFWSNVETKPRMNAMSLTTTGRRLKAELSSTITQLAQLCPACQGNPDDCPLHRLRQMKSVGRRKWLNALAQEDLVYLVSYHQVCLFTKLTIG